MKIPYQISINIVNNTPANQRINLMSNPYDLQANVNNTTQYRWNITGYDFSSNNQVSIQYKINSATSFTTYLVSVNANLSPIISALNGLGVGFFYTYTSSGLTYITTYNNAYAFSLLSFNGAIPPPVPPTPFF